MRSLRAGRSMNHRSRPWDSRSSFPSTGTENSMVPDSLGTASSIHNIGTLSRTLTSRPETSKLRVSERIAQACKLPC
jgi:hypothetical protein